MKTHERRYDLLTIDGIDVDLVMTVARLPGPDEKVMSELVGTLPGGPAANSACAASRLGLRVAAMAELGDDAYGQLVVADFADYGVDTSLIHTRPGGQTCFTVILVPPGGEKAVVVVPTFTPVHPEEQLRAALGQARFVYMMPLANFTQVARLARACGAEVVIDIEPQEGVDTAGMRGILAGCDIASFNQFGFRAAWGREPTIAAARELLADGPHTVVVTLGSRGALAVTRDEAAEHPGFPVAAVDTTGAGDVFNAAFLSATVRGLPLAERLRFACAAGALAVTGMGPRGCLPTAAEVAAFADQHG